MADQGRQNARFDTRTTDDVQEIEQAFIMAREQGESLAAWLERYPQHAVALIDLASALDAYDNAPAPDAQAVVAMTKMLRTALAQVAGPLTPTPVPGLVAQGRKLGLSVPQFARHLHLTNDILVKLDQGVLQMATIPRSLFAQLATVLQSTQETIEASLRQQPTAQGAFFYAKQAPDAPQQQSFVDALGQSQDLSPADREYWLAIAREEGLLP